MSRKQDQRKTLTPGQYKPFNLKESYGTHKGKFYTITAYTHDQKELFLRDAITYLRALGQELAWYGFNEMRLRRNKAGIAVSGEVLGEYWHPNFRRWIYLWLQESVMGFDTRREDGLLLTARWREPFGKDSYTEGPNVTHDPSMSSDQMARTLLYSVLRIRPADAVVLRLIINGGE